MTGTFARFSHAAKIGAARPPAPAKTRILDVQKIAYATGLGASPKIFEHPPLTENPVQPATSALLGSTENGLPVGRQIIGAEGEDRITIEFARLLAAEIGGFVPPPSFA
jgi:hypothetical protein